MSLTQKTLAELSHDFQSGNVSSREITEAFIKNIEEKNAEINAVVTPTFDQALEMADQADARQKNNALLSPLDGMPITLKDVVCTEGIRTTGCSNIIKNFVPPYSATVWKKLQSAGAVLLGKVNTDEFTMGSSTETSAFGVTNNPHDLTRVAGGSSGGSAASISAEFCTASVGTDTGGSIRQPAHFCGCTGLKVSYGRVSRYGVMPMASSLDTIGPLAKTVKDCAMMLQIMAGKDPCDATTPDVPVPDYIFSLNNSIKGLKIGVPEEYINEGISAETQQALETLKKLLSGMGATIEEISLPHTKYAIPVYYLIAPSEISANMARFDGVRFGEGFAGKNLKEIYTETRKKGFGDEVKRRILLGTYALSAGYYDAYYRKAQKVRTLIKQDFENIFQSYDAIIAPTSPTPAFEIGENTSDPLKMYMEDVLTIPASLAGIAGLSIPIQKSAGNLPIGVQILGPAFSEEKILNIGHQVQSQ